MTALPPPVEIDRAVCSMRCLGHTISAIAWATDLTPAQVEHVLAAKRLLGPWSPDWRDRMRERAA